jgi:hypothetical protein
MTRPERKRYYAEAKRLTALPHRFEYIRWSPSDEEAARHFQVLQATITRYVLGGTANETR